MTYQQQLCRIYIQVQKSWIQNSQEFMTEKKMIKKTEKGFVNNIPAFLLTKR